MVMAAKKIDPRVDVLNRLLKNADKDASWLARQLGLSDVRKVYGWVNGEYGPRDKSLWDRMIEIAQGASARTHELLAPLPIFRRGTKFIPLYHGLAAGLPGSSEGDVEYLEVMDWGNQFERWGRIIEGFSMEPTINPGEIVVFEDRRPEHSHIVHAFKSGEDVCKVYWRDSTGAWLKSINPAYEDIPIEGWTIKGVAVQRIIKEDDGLLTKDYNHGMRHRFSSKID